MHEAAAADSTTGERAFARVMAESPATPRFAPYPGERDNPGDILILNHRVRSLEAENGELMQRQRALETELFEARRGLDGERARESQHRARLRALEAENAELRSVSHGATEVVRRAYGLEAANLELRSALALENARHEAARRAIDALRRDAAAHQGADARVRALEAERDALARERDEAREQTAAARGDADAARRETAAHYARAAEAEARA